jgi:hypothetical protein
MRDFLSAVEPIKVETELGAIYVQPNGSGGATVNAPHLTVDGAPLQASAFLVSGDGVSWNLIQSYDSATGRLSTPPHAIRATLVDGREADIVLLGKVAQVVISAVRKLAQTNQGIFIEAERRAVINEIAALERGIEGSQAKIKEKEAKLTQIEQKLSGRGD